MSVREPGPFPRAAACGVDAACCCTSTPTERTDLLRSLLLERFPPPHDTSVAKRSAMASAPIGRRAGR